MLQNLCDEFLTQSFRCYLIEKSQPQSPELTLEQTEECLRFLYLTHLTSGPIPVNQDVDKIWHLLILQTKEYFDLCDRLPSKKYLHHTSDVYLKYVNISPFAELSKELEAKRQLEWLVSYVSNFGDMKQENIKYWSFAAAFCNKFQWSAADFNIELRTLIRPLA